MHKILIIEDNEYLGRMYQNLLSLEKFEIKWVATGDEGLKIAEEFQPDLILLDIIMPKTNGITILKQLKENPQTQNIKVVMLTVLGEKDMIDQCMKLGAKGYIIKSTYNLDELLSEIDSYLKEPQ
jgi:two-component system, sensor histidine kinase and response regulator